MRSLPPLLRQLLALLLILLMQGPAMLTQEIAWARMLVTYTTERGVVRGVMETFDGQHPCKLCEKAAEWRRGKPSNNPPDRSNELRYRLSWAEMLPAGNCTIPATPEQEWLRERPVEIILVHGRLADAPTAPPPEHA